MSSTFLKSYLKHNIFNSKGGILYIKQEVNKSILALLIEKANMQNQMIFLC